MKLKFFMIPVHDPGKKEEELNQWLGSSRVITVDREFVADGINSFWSICVTYLATIEPNEQGKKARTDYKEVLSESEFALFAKLRTKRKELAEREGVPAYAIFTNEQLAGIVQGEVQSLTGLKSISGVGPSRIEKYGSLFLGLIKEHITTPAATEQTTGNGKTFESESV